ncbi:MAG: hypothetical protein K2P64_04835 [Lachnospiraceae bacterium]|nr:hypothetical protein [Lachnospiraceae bacterium]
MYRELNEKEQQWIDSLMNVKFQGRVPVEMRAFQQASAPIVFLLHIVSGIINELEIITADSTKIEADNIELARVEYEINREVIMKG